MSEPYQKAYQAALDERNAILARRAKEDQRLAQLEKIIESLEPLCGEGGNVTAFPSDLANYGLADACRIVLRTLPRFITPITIRDILVREEYDLSGQSNALASVHSIAKRLVQSGEAEEQVIDGKTYYRWKQPSNLSDLRTTLTNALRGARPSSKKE